MSLLAALHSPSCAQYNGSLFVAFYAGEREGINQRVFIFKKDKKISLYKKLPIGSGNPVLIELNGDLWCAYSMFTQSLGNKCGIADLWETSYVCLENLSSNKKTILSTYCCPRINPLYMKDNSVILPCYDENIKRGIFFHFSMGESLKRYVCLKTEEVIQPSLVYIDNRLFCLFRNFKKNVSYNTDQCYAPFTEVCFSKAKNELLFKQSQMSKIPNHNESISTINDKENNSIAIFNANRGRTNLTLGLLRLRDQTIISENNFIINERNRASYPNCCFNEKNQLIVVYTSYDGRGINFGSSICISEISSKYDRVIKRDYITSEML